MITFSAIGRLGRFANAGFQICSSIGISDMSGQDFAFPVWRNYDALERFASTEDIDVYRHFVNALPTIETNNFQWQPYPYFWGYRSLHLPYGNWDLSGHLQSDKFFINSIDKVRYYMTMHDEEKHDAIAVHLRCGDYGGDYHPRMTADYYRAALELLPTDMDIFLFSDELPEAIKIMGEIGRKYVPIDKDYLESFKIMKGCRHFVCANSSYSLLASILANANDKQVVVPRKWFGPASGLDVSDIPPINSICL